MSVGIDLVEHIRLKDSYEKFALRYLSSEELEVYNTFKLEKRKLEYVASRLAVKECVFKVYKSGDGTLDFKDISVLNNEDGSPYIKIKGKLQSDLDVSISHTLNYSTAIVIK